MVRWLLLIALWSASSGIGSTIFISPGRLWSRRSFRSLWIGTIPARIAARPHSSESAFFALLRRRCLHRCIVNFWTNSSLPLLQAMGSTEGGNVFSNPVPPGKNKIGSPGLPWGFETRIVDERAEMYRGANPAKCCFAERLDDGVLQGPRGHGGGGGQRRMVAYRGPGPPGRGRLLLRRRPLQRVDH